MGVFQRWNEASHVVVYNVSDKPNNSTLFAKNEPPYTYYFGLSTGKPLDYRQQNARNPLLRYVWSAFNDRPHKAVPTRNGFEVVLL